MSKKYLLTIVITALLAAGLTESRHFIGAHISHSNSDTENRSAVHSPYAGQEARNIKSLSQTDIEGLLAGAGTPFGGMAKPAELNGYPGPLHVLQAIEAAEFEVTDEQRTRIQNLYDKMKEQAVTLGERIVAIEQQIDDDFTNRTVTEEKLQSNIEQSARFYEQLRFVHLKHHLRMVDVLTPEQVAQYNTLRGYIGDENDPCEKVPEGHNPALWRMHNDC